MKIFVILRMMPDAAVEFEVMDDGSGLDREWLDFQLNDFDDQALEEAILLKEARNGHVTAVALGEGAKRVLQMAVARGADEAIELDGDISPFLSTPWLARSLVGLIEDSTPDLVLTGVQSGEDLHGQLAPYLGALLGWPHLSGTSRVGAAPNGLDVAQERGGGTVAHYRVALPAVLGVQTASKAPRYVSGSKLREAAKTPIGRHALSSEAPRAASRATMALPDQSTGAESLGDTPDAAADRIVSILAERGLTGSRLQ